MTWGMCATGASADEGRIRPYEANPFYWQYRGEPVVLIGASDYHNIFQRPDLVEHLQKLKSVGGNYVRNTMSSREILEDHRDLWPYRIDPDRTKPPHETRDPLRAVYDLDEWNDAYWERFERMLEVTARLGIIVEIEIWERHDLYRTRDQAGWERHPYNPDNNVNYTAEESGLPTGEWVQDPGHPFFATVPALDNNELVLGYQRRFVDKILSYTLDYNHVLYNMNNETKERPEWGEYWGRYILERAREAGVEIELTDMQAARDMTDESVRRVMDSGLWTYVDISQNNLGARGERHWERIQHIREHLAGAPKPITNIKLYGADGDHDDHWGDTREAVERFWRNIMGGAASVRFHRPPWGIGLNETAQAHVRSMRILTDAMHVFTSEPRNDLLGERAENEAYCLAEPGRRYAVYFPDGGSVELDVSDATGRLMVRWLDLERSKWSERRLADASDGVLRLQAPGPGHWAVLVLADNR